GYTPRDVAKLSGVEAERVFVARALANWPVVLVMDEPASAIDDESKLGVESLIQGIIKGSRLACMIVTNDMAQAARMANRVMILEAGHAVRIGSVEEVLHA